MGRQRANPKKEADGEGQLISFFGDQADPILCLKPEGMKREKKPSGERIYYATWPAGGKQWIFGFRPLTFSAGDAPERVECEFGFTFGFGLVNEMEKNVWTGEWNLMLILSRFTSFWMFYFKLENIKLI